MASSEGDYLSRIEEHFGKRRGGPLLLSPKDWQLVEDWKRQEIPLGVVLRGINLAFDRFVAAGPRPDKINSLAFCAQEVAAAWEEHRAQRSRESGRAGDETGGALPGASRHLSALAGACRAAAGLDAPLDELLRTTAAQLEELAGAAREGELDARAVDLRATALQRQLESALRGAGRQGLADLGLSPFSPYEV